MWNRRNEKGGVALEFALIAPVLLVMLLGIVDFGQLVLMKTKLSSATRAGVQYAITVDTNEAIIEDIVENSTSFEDADNLSVTVDPFCECSDGTAVLCDGSCASGNVREYVTVSATYDLPLLFSYPGVTSPFPVTSFATLRMK